MSNEVQSFLDKIKEVQDSNKVKLELPSKTKALESSPLTFKQQKELISTVADGAVGLVRFQKVLNDIILDNTKDNTLNIQDKVLAAIQYRIHSISPTYKAGGIEVPLKDFIQPLLDKSKNQFLSVERKEFTLHVKIPTLLEENKVHQTIIADLKKSGDRDSSKTLGDIYTYEICKYVDRIEFGDEVIKFSDLKPQEMAKVVESLPLDVNKNIIKFIQDLKKTQDEILTVYVDDKPHIIEIDVNFFDS